MFCRPGDDLLSQVLRHSTIGAKAFDGRVRDGIGSDHLAKATRPAKDRSFVEVNVTLVFEILSYLCLSIPKLPPSEVWASVRRRANALWRDQQPDGCLMDIE